MKEFKVEYLILMDDAGSFCDGKTTFNKLLQVNSDIKISNNKLTYKKNFDVGYNLISGEVENKGQRFFQITLNAQCEAEKLDVFVELIRDVKQIIQKSGGKPEILIDDVSSYYSQESYPLIHRIENKMRKLITNFMLRKIGTSWLKDSSPETFKQAVEKSKRKDAPQSNAVYKVDFIHLADFLFKPYSVHNVKNLFDKLDEAVSLEELDLEKIKEFIPKSNWQRYFSEIVDCDDTFLDKRWRQLYDLRCLIAHNAIVNKRDYEDIRKIVDEINVSLDKAIKDIDKISVPADDKEVVAESVMSNINLLYGEFIRSWKYLDSLVFKLSKNLNMHIKRRSLSDGTMRNYAVPRHALYRELTKSSILPRNLLEKLMYLQDFRNRLMHAEEIYADSEIERNTFLVHECTVQVHRIYEKFSQRRAIVDIDENMPETMEGIIRVGRVLIENDEEVEDRQDLVDNTEFHSINELISFISSQTGIPESNVEISH
ncbi:hypothetical protein GPM19_08935 [Halomonas sp. ZH2S]|uniref:Apea-like HEPN domain-containing protein n=1 Tax=Vreelandella zhuhanensis TaxID=2684210 RepID=A0A7X3H0K6_9GAMM|nr:HEPN domain-containing protein [Halomonas zhuhanensis]MWJ28327.1 hypothetical protein [Halomonas zhuhanensis]